MKLATLPDWIIQASHERDAIQRESEATPEPVQQAMKGTNRRSYGQVALDGEAARMATAATGTRYHTLGSTSYRLGRLIGAGELDHTQARAALLNAAKACRYVQDHGEATVRKEIETGLNAGMLNPRGRQPHEAARQSEGREEQSQVRRVAM